jgi:ribosome-associated translation inhibitor RaiA
MQLPLQITLHGIDHSDALDEAIRSKTAKLEQLHPGIVSCRIVVEQVARHKHQGNDFAVRIDLKMPGHEIAVTRHQNEDVYVALRDAFAAARREIESHARGHHKLAGKRLAAELNEVPGTAE